MSKELATVEPQFVSPVAPDWGINHGITDLWTEVAPGLWVGGTQDEDVYGAAAQWEFDRNRQVAPIEWEPMLTSEYFDAVVTMYAYARPAGWGVSEYRWHIYDDRDQEPTFSDEEFDEVVAWAHRRWKSGQRVLIRCQAGLNRSAMVTSAVLMKDGWTLPNAVEEIRGRRSPDCLFNRQFVRYLIRRSAQQ